MISGLYKKGVNPKDIKQVKDFIVSFDFEETILTTALDECISLSKPVCVDVVQTLCKMHGPMHMSTFLSVLSFKREETTDYQIQIKQALKILVSYDIINLSNSALASNKTMSSYDFIENPKTILVIKNKTLMR